MRTASFPLSRLALIAAAGFFSAGFAGLAQANDVYWSVGVASPGVSIGVSNSRPVLVVPAPVYVQPAPIYRRAVPIFVQPQVVYVQPHPAHGGNGWHKGNKRGDKHGRYGYGYGRDRGELHGYSAYAPVHVQPQVQYGHDGQYGRSPQVYGGVYGQLGHPPSHLSGWR